MDNPQDTHEDYLNLAVAIAREHMEAGAGGCWGSDCARQHGNRSRMEPRHLRS